MGSLKDIRKRISSVKETKKITRAMNMVASAKLRRTEDKLLSLRPYADELIELIETINYHIQSENPFYAEREKGYPLYVFISADKGLCGAFNSKITKKAQELLNESSECESVIIGKKAKRYFDRNDMDYINSYIDFFEELSYNDAKKVANFLSEYYLKNEKIKEIIFVYNRFKNTIVSNTTVEKFLPRKREESGEEEKKVYESEPDLKSMLTYAITEYLESEVYRIMLESLTSEHGARMAAMDAATDNAQDMIDNLTMEANRKRQAEITKEISEIVGGSNALEG
ncbi:MAG: ATP synthase F1 subunit gamma [Candidatus Mcinerneyibacterium aminivorans]|uniref:ATP synthase gamma chain n=1 Tax=Candidatus Mcinerneyibacterium aminivorans TaxID=2703815 RepID=A0A5D0MGP5_9BACT|nr:MAG: ATP synthase F1 subunit gamma [Candidatus Mcinerneyibacterium aminivorans]